MGLLDNLGTWVGITLIVVGTPLILVAWRHWVCMVWGRYAAAGAIVAGLAFIAGGAVLIPPLGPSDTEREASSCAATSGIKPADMTEAQADPDEPLLHVPWDDKAPWTFNELKDIDCGASLGGASVARRTRPAADDHGAAGAPSAKVPSA